MQPILLKKCSIVETQIVLMITCSTTYANADQCKIEFEDDGTQESSSLALAHDQFKKKYSQLDEVPENASITVGSYCFKTGTRYKRGLSVPQIRSIDYYIEEAHKGDKDR